MKKLLYISYLEHKTNDWVRSKINFFVGPQESLVATVRRRKLAWFGLVTHHNSFSKTNFRGWVMPWLAEEMLDGQHQRVDIPALARTAYSGLLQKDWKKISAESSVMSLP